MVNEMNLNNMYAHAQYLIKTIDKNHPLQSHHYMTIEDKDFKGKILDAGSGYGEFGIVAKLMKPNIDMHCLDMNPFVATLGKFLSIKAGVDIEFTGKELGIDDDPVFDDNEFDCITLSHVVEHIEDLDKLFTWVNKILKMNGIIYLSFPHMNAHDSPEHCNYFCGEDDKIINSVYNGKQNCINIEKYLKKFNYEYEILLFDEEKADKRHPHKSHGQLDYYIKIKMRSEK